MVAISRLTIRVPCRKSRLLIQRLDVHGISCAASDIHLIVSDLNKMIRYLYRHKLALRVILYANWYIYSIVSTFDIRRIRHWIKQTCLCMCKFDYLVSTLEVPDNSSVIYFKDKEVDPSCNKLPLKSMVVEFYLPSITIRALFSNIFLKIIDSFKGNMANL